MKPLRNLCVLASLMMLSACGGGSGGNSNSSQQPGNDSLHITLNNSSLDWNYYEGTTPSSDTLTAVATGIYSGTVYVAVFAQNDGSTNAIDPNIQLSLSNTVSTATIMPAANLPAGTYAGRLVFLACADSACKTPIGGTPLYVNFSVTVKAIIKATPSTLDVSAVSGNTATTNVAVQPGVNETDYEVTSVPSFAQVTNKTNSSFQLRFSSLPVGTYTGQILLTGSLGTQRTVPVSYVVSAPSGGEHGLSVSLNSMTFNAAETMSTPIQTIQITQPTWLPGVTYSIDYGGMNYNWLTITPSATGYDVDANAATLSAGTYTATIHIQANNLPSGISDPFGNPEELISVSFTVGKILVTPADVYVNFTGDTTTADLTGLVPINVTPGSAAVNWNAYTNNGLVGVSQSGQSGTNLQFSIDSRIWEYFSGLGSDISVNVTVYVANTSITPATFTIHVINRLSSIYSIGPGALVAGQPGKITVVGTGFAGISNLASHFVVSDVTISSVQRISDNKVILNLNTLPNGSHSVNINNNLGNLGSPAFFDAVTAPTYTYTAIPTGFFTRVLIPDDEQGGLYIVNDSSSTLIKYSFGTSGWSSTVSPVKDIGSIGIFPGFNIFATTVSGDHTSDAVRILDRDSLVEMSAHPYGNGLPTPYATNNGIPVTPDGKAWLQLGSQCGSYVTLGYYSADTQIVPANLNGAPSIDTCGQYFGELRFSPSRNGDRVIVSNSNSYGPTYPLQQPMAFIDLSDNSVHPMPSTTTGIYNWDQGISTSNDSSRTVIDSSTVLDGRGNVIGSIQIADYGTTQYPSIRQSTVLSPDGQRAYVLMGQIDGVTTPSRVYVVDTSTSRPASSLPVLGYFELADSPSCPYSGCDWHPPAAISMDGSTLFFAGSDKLVIAPIPKTLTPVSSASSNHVNIQSVKTKAWPVLVGRHAQ